MNTVKNLHNIVDKELSTSSGKLHISPLKYSYKENALTYLFCKQGE